MDMIAALGIWVVLLIAGPVVLLVVVLLLKRLRSCGLAVMLSWAQRGLPIEGHDYLAKWVESWEHEFTKDLHGRGITGVSAEVSFLARILTLPFSIRSLRREALEMTKPRPTTQVARPNPVVIEVSVPAPTVSVGGHQPSGTGTLKARRHIRIQGIPSAEAFGMPAVIVGDGWRGEAFSPVPVDDPETEEDKREGGVIESP